jgi:hypothetical protein
MEPERSPALIFDVSIAMALLVAASGLRGTLADLAWIAGVCGVVELQRSLYVRSLRRWPGARALHR